MNITGAGNEVISIDNLSDLSKCKISIVGDSNKIIFNGRLDIRGRLSINIKASNNTIIFDKNIIVNRNLNISIIPAGSGAPSYSNSVYIGDNCFFNGDCSLILAENNNAINIGENCLLASGVDFNTSDSHPVFSLSDGKRLNVSKSINIGSHVWIGSNVHLLKGSGIGNDSVIGAHSVVTEYFNESNVALGGNPAKVIKRDVDWRQDARIERI